VGDRGTTQWKKKSILNRETIVHVWSVLDRETSVPI